MDRGGYAPVLHISYEFERGRADMKDYEIIKHMGEHTGIDMKRIDDYRPCNQLYTKNLGIPTIHDAITVTTVDGDTIIYIPKTDNEGKVIDRSAVSHTSIPVPGIDL